jgi:hypothetical protein
MGIVEINPHLGLSALLRVVPVVEQISHLYFFYASRDH